MLFYLKNTELHYVKTAIFEIAHKCLSSVATNALFLMGVDTRKTTSFGYFCHTRNLTKKSLDKAREKIFLKFKPRMIAINCKSNPVFFEYILLKEAVGKFLEH